MIFLLALVKHLLFQSGSASIHNNNCASFDHCPPAQTNKHSYGSVSVPEIVERIFAQACAKTSNNVTINFASHSFKRLHHWFVFFCAKSVCKSALQFELASSIRLEKHLKNLYKTSRVRTTNYQINDSIRSD